MRPLSPGHKKRFCPRVIEVACLPQHSQRGWAFRLAISRVASFDELKTEAGTATLQVRSARGSASGESTLRRPELQGRDQSRAENSAESRGEQQFLEHRLPFLSICSKQTFVKTADQFVESVLLSVTRLLRSARAASSRTPDQTFSILPEVSTRIVCGVI